MSNANNQFVRGEVLRILRIQYPYSYSEHNLAAFLEGLGMHLTDAELSSHMAYLREKGYISSDQVHETHTGLKRWMHTLSSKGIDLIERNIPDDPGVRTPNIAQ